MLVLGPMALNEKVNTGNCITFTIGGSASALATVEAKGVSRGLGYLMPLHSLG